MSKLLHEAFLARVEEAPNSTALRWPDGSMTYRDLADRSLALALRLRDAGVGTETLVGLSVERGPALVVGILGVIRAGGAWLPLDPAYPAERLAFMVADSGVERVIADAGCAERLPDGLHIIDPEVARSAPVIDGPAPAVAAGDLAYVIYTSGSTGRPKGALIEHGSVAATVAGMRHGFGVVSDDRVLQFASASFDASICEIGIALTAGATLVIADRASTLPGPGLVELMAREQVSIAVLAPSVVAAIPDCDLPALRTLVCAGEALPLELAKKWGAGRRLINAYGPTEAAICATAGEVRLDGGRLEKPTIGRPLDGVRLQVLDQDLRPVPQGESGELAIGGIGVGRGYLNRAELTAERFVTDANGERLYRTGDRVRELPDGNFEFFGRIDHQIKLRGYRIEPDEITEVLRAHADVRNAVVVPHEDRLVAYVVADGADSAALRSWCEARLPDYMIPSAIISLAALPLTPSGKVDRAGLPAPDRADIGLAAERRTPRTGTEEALAELFGELLNVPDVGADDDFFALGGHSLLIGRLAARIRSRFGIELSLPVLYANPTVAGMAALVDRREPGGGAADIPSPPPLRRADRDQPIPLSFPQERVWILDRISEGNLAYQAQASLRLRGPLDVAALVASLTEIVRRHEIFRTGFREIDGVPVQEPVAHVPVEVPVVDLSELTPKKRSKREREVMDREFGRRFRLDEPPLARWMILRHAEDDHTLLHAEHHLVHDGWSFSIFVEELAALYEAFMAKQPSPLPDPPLQFADLAIWQRDWLSGDVLKAFLDHWTGRLAGAPPALELPTDRPRPPAFRFLGDAVSVEFSAAEYAALRAGARRHGVTLFTVMLAGFGALLSRYAGQSDMVVGVGSANRRLEEAERLIGMVINTLPMRLDLSGDPDAATLLGRVHDVSVDAHAWQDVPLDRLVEALAPVRDPSRNPLFSVIFSFHDAPVPDLEFGGLRGEVTVRHNGSAKADINIVVIPRAEQRVGRASDAEKESLTLIWEYATDLFDPETMAQMIADYRRLLGSMLDDPSLPLSRLRLRAVEPPSGADRPPDRPRVNLVDMVERWAAERPNAVAVADGDGTIRYRQLAGRAAALARSLRLLGAGPECPVAIVLERGRDLVVAMLAAQMCGATCLIVDPDTPARMARNRIGGAIVATGRSIQHLVAADRTVLVDAPGDGAAADDRINGEAEAGRSAEIAGVVGPDGEEISGAALACMIAALQAADLCGGQVPQIAPPGSPLQLIEIWGALTRGGTVRVLPCDTTGAEALADALKEAAATAPLSTLVLPSAVGNALATRHPESLKDLGALLVMGADTDANALRRLAAPGSPSRRLFGLGTPTVPLAFLSDAGDVPDDATVIPVGAPVRGVTASVRDANLCPVPPRVYGELHVGLTADSSVGAATGWRARWRHDGQVEVVGPSGSWACVKGMRVLPTVVRTALTSHPDVAEAAVIVRDDKLVAYVVHRPDGRAPDTAALRSHLAERLPPYQCPCAFVPLPALPVDRFGRVDHSALPGWDDRPPAPGLPATETERRIGALCAELLGVGAVAPHDDFFALGGRSLLATRLVARVNREFGVDVPVARFLLSPDVASLAAAVDAAEPDSFDQPLHGTRHDAARLLASLDRLSADEVRAILRDTEMKS